MNTAHFGTLIQKTTLHTPFIIFTHNYTKQVKSLLLPEENRPSQTETLWSQVTGHFTSGVATFFLLITFL